MAQRGQDLLSRLADRGEEAIQRLAEAPGANRFVDAATGLRDRVDELQKRVRGIDAIERRVEVLERRLDELSGTKGTSGRSAGAKRTTRSKTAPGTTSKTRGGRAAGKAVRKSAEEQA